VTPKTGLLGPTYRLQLTPQFNFSAAEAVLSHVAWLGAEFVYLSPIFEARPGSDHGYDVVDPNCVRSELGGQVAFESLAQTAHAEGLQILLDIVPNHLSTYLEGPYWRDVLQKGEASAHARLFDIDWASGEGKVILPILGAPLEEILSDGALGLEQRGDESVLCYHESALPLAAGSEEISSLKELLAAQHYRLSYWRAPERNYRRFFTIDDLVGVRQEDRSVFEFTHEALARLLEDDLVDAVRVDHVDGLADPASYLECLAGLVGRRPIVVEKILTGDEQLRSSWPISGTTGYEVADDIRLALADEEGMTELAGSAAIEGEQPTETVIRQAKELVVDSFFPSEVGRVASLLKISSSEVARAAVAMPVYRTYVSRRGAEALDRYLLSVAGGERFVSLAEPSSEAALEGVVRFQQLTSAAMAKGVEDTAWYRLAGRLAFLEVGGDPEGPDQERGPERLVRRSKARLAAREYGLIPGSTHDTKRSADVRARLLALAGLASQFETGLARFAAELPSRPLGDDPAAPGPLDRRRIAETCLGLAPFPTEPDEAFDDAAGRVAAALAKGAREAKSRDSWESVNGPYEQALGDAAQSLLKKRAALLRRCFPFLPTLQRNAAVISLAQVVLRSFLPGAPDSYQGEETWSFALVDPDNRRPVDYHALDELARSLPNELTPDLTSALASQFTDGRVKLAVTRGCLLARRRAAEAFSPSSDLHSLAIRSLPEPSALLGLTRGAPGKPEAVALVTRLPHKVASGPGLLHEPGTFGTAAADLPAGRYYDALSGATHEVGSGGLLVESALSFLPVALLFPAVV
jgi:(1->4)-alpha-D-glucan 1-alpha-D-glucosylmutase